MTTLCSCLSKRYLKDAQSALICRTRLYDYVKAYCVKESGHPHVPKGVMKTPPAGTDVDLLHDLRTNSSLIGLSIMKRLRYFIGAAHVSLVSSHVY